MRQGDRRPDQQGTEGLPGRQRRPAGEVRCGTGQAITAECRSEQDQDKGSGLSVQPERLQQGDRREPAVAVAGQPRRQG